MDILFTSDTTFLALERSLTTNPNTSPAQTNQVKIYQANQFFAFRVVTVPEASTLPLMVGAGVALLGVALARRSRKRANG